MSSATVLRTRVMRSDKLTESEQRAPSMSPQDLKIGCAYYRVTYADPDLTIPGVQPMFYVGTNIAEDDDPATLVYYFQDTISHTWRGSVTDPAHGSKHPEIEVAVFPHTESEVQREVFTLDEVIAALTEAQRLRSAIVNQDITASPWVLTTC